MRRFLQATLVACLCVPVGLMASCTPNEVDSAIKKPTLVQPLPKVGFIECFGQPVRKPARITPGCGEDPVEDLTWDWGDTRAVGRGFIDSKPVTVTLTDPVVTGFGEVFSTVEVSAAGSN